MQLFSSFGKMFEIKAPREESDVRLNHCSGKSIQGCNVNKNSTGQKAAGVRDSEEHDCRGARNQLEFFLRPDVHASSPFLSPQGSALHLQNVDVPCLKTSQSIPGCVC